MADRNFYAWYRAHGVCVRCRKEDAAPGHSMCPECMAKQREAGRRFQAAHPGYNRRKMAERRERLPAGICICCCGAPAKPGNKLCEKCLEYNREYNRRRASK